MAAPLSFKKDFYCTSNESPEFEFFLVVFHVKTETIRNEDEEVPLGNVDHGLGRQSWADSKGRKGIERKQLGGCSSIATKRLLIN